MSAQRRPDPTEHRARHRVAASSFAVVALLAVVAAGCSNSADEAGIEQLIEEQTGGSVDIDLDDGGLTIESEEGNLTVDEDGSFTVEGEDGEVLTGEADGEGDFTIEGDDGSFTVNQGGEIPEEWPDDVPEPEGLEVTTSSVVDTGGGTAVNMTGTVEDAAAFVESYANALESAGLASTFSTESGGAISALFANDSWQLSIGTSELDGQQQVTVSLFPAG